MCLQDWSNMIPGPKETVVVDAKNLWLPIPKILATVESKLEASIKRSYPVKQSKAGNAKIILAWEKI